MSTVFVRCDCEKPLAFHIKENKKTAEKEFKFMEKYSPATLLPIKVLCLQKEL